LNLDQAKTFSVSSLPSNYKKKFDILQYFKNHFKEPKPSKNLTESENTKSIYLQKWLRTKHAIFFKLSDGVVQTNFFDHHKIIIWDHGDYVTYINDLKEYYTYRTSELFMLKNEKIFSRIKYINDIIVYLLEKSNPTPSAELLHPTDAIKMTKQTTNSISKRLAVK
jgi:hypothetical protein